MFIIQYFTLVEYKINLCGFIDLNDLKILNIITNTKTLLRSEMTSSLIIKQTVVVQFSMCYNMS